jgi:branched-chain amino acid transport system substrate-binding protein
MGTVFMSLFLILSLFLVMVPRGAKAEDTVKIGQLDPFSGPVSFVGPEFYRPIKFVVDEQNAKGGLLGKKVEVISEDNEWKPETAVRKAKKLILEDKVKFFGSGTGSHIAMALSKVAKSYKTIGINYGFSQPVPKKDFTRYYFRANVSPYHFASATAQLMAKKPYRKFYIICQDYAYGHAHAKNFEAQIKIHLPDAKIVGVDFHPVGTKDFGPYINKIINAKADCIYSSDFGIDALNLIKQARALGLKAPFPFISSVGSNPFIMYQLKDDGVGIHHAHSYLKDIKVPENQEMIAKWHEQYKEDKEYSFWWPTAFGGSIIYAWKMIFAAVEEAGSLDTEKIIDVLEGFWWKSPLGWYEMRKCDHQMIMPVFGAVVVAGWNPWWNGSIRPEIKFPWNGPNTMVRFPAMETAFPPWGF